MVPVSPAAKAQMLPNNHRWVFTLTGDTPMNNHGKHKAILDRATGTEGWVLHDLRRTARTLMSRAGVNSEIAERVLGHVTGGVAGIYNRYAYLEEKREALAKLATLVGEIVS